MERENRKDEQKNELIKYKSFPKAAHCVISWAEDFQQIVVGAWDERQAVWED